MSHANDAPALDHIFAALADPTRRAVLARLKAGPSTVTALAEPFPMALSSFSKHLKVLETAGLIARTQDGRFHQVAFAREGLAPGLEWLADSLGERAAVPDVPPTERPRPGRGARARTLAQALVTELTPAMTAVAAALRADEQAPVPFSPAAVRTRLLADEVRADAQLGATLHEALGWFERLRHALAQPGPAGDETLKAAVKPLGHLVYAWRRHPVLADAFTAS